MANAIETVYITLIVIALVVGVIRALAGDVVALVYALLAWVIIEIMIQSVKNMYR